MTASAFGQLSVTSTGSITINDVSPATPFPSTNIIASGSTAGVVEKVTVKLNGVSHGYPDDIDMLLRSPSGQETMLWGDAGGRFSISNIDVTLDSSASTFLPDEAQITSGTYAPADYDGAGDNDAILLNAAPAPVGPIDTSFDKYYGKPSSSIEGNWYLYVADDHPVDTGSIRSWTLNVFLSPVLQLASSSATTLENSSVTVNLTVTDTDSALSGLTLTASSDNTAVIPNSGITFRGDPNSTNRTVTITPALNANGGPVHITITAKDEQGQTFAGVNSQVLTVTVTPVDQPPTLVLGSTSATIGQGGITNPINVQVQDVDNPATDLVLTAISSNPGVIPATNVLFTRVASGSVPGTNRTVQIAANAAVGTSTITIIATDPAGSNAVANITVTVTSIPQIVGANPTAITLPSGVSGGAGTPYPSVITIPSSAGLGLVGKVTVSLNAVEHPNSSDIGVLLVSPSGQSAVLMRDVGGTSNVQPIGLGDTNDVRLTFDASAGTQINQGQLTTSTNRPNDLQTTLDFPAAAPVHPYSTDLNVFSGSQVNGDWKLYVYDLGFFNTSPAQIAGGWVLTIAVAPTISGLGDITTLQDTSKTVSFQVADLEGSVTNVTTQLLNPGRDTGRLTLTTTLSGGTATLTVNPSPHQNTGFGPPSPIPVAVIVQDNAGGFTATNIINIFVTPVNDPPTQSIISKQITSAGQTLGPIKFTVSDLQTLNANNLTVTATSDNPKLLPQGAIILGIDPTDPSGATRTITFFPTGSAGGSANVTVTVTDDGAGSPTGTKASSSQVFTLTVNPAANPLFENVTSISIPDATSVGTPAPAVPYPSTITVGGLVGSVAEVQVTLYGVTHPQPEDLDILLVGPGSSPTGVMLMSDVGGSNPINGVTLHFRQSATQILPDAGQIVSGDYLPTDPNVGNDVFPPPTAGGQAPTITLNANLSAFNGISPNGDWKLYVVDDTPGPVGAPKSFISSWQLSIRTHVALGPIPTQTTPENSPFRLTVTAGDVQPGVTNTVTASLSLSPTTQPVIASIKDSAGHNILGASVPVTGGSQTFTFTPGPDAVGTNSVTLTFTDPDGVSVSQSFLVVVTSVDQAPRFTLVPGNQTTGTAIALNLPNSVNAYDPEGGTITITATSSNPSVVSDSGIVITPATAGTPNTNSAPARTITITPNDIANGVTTITLTASDVGGNKTTASFTLTVTPSVASVNTNPIIINDNAPATPYPSTIDVSGITGTVSGATVVVNGFSHTFPSDVDILLVAPDGRAVMLLGDAGDGSPVSNLRLTFADGAPAAPQNLALQSTTYSPTDYGKGGEIGEMPAPAPAAPSGGFSTSLASLAGVNPNGRWSLYVRDDTFGESGTISGGWILLLKTAPTIAPIPDQVMQENTPLPIRFTVSDQDTPASGLSVSVSISPTNTTFANPGLFPVLTAPPFNANIGLTTNGSSFPSVNYTLTLLPTTNQPSVTYGLTAPATNRVTISVNDGTSTNTTSFLVVVQPVNQAPTVAGAFSPVGSAQATNHVVTAETTSNPSSVHPITIRFKVADVDSRLGTSSNIVVQSSNPSLLPNASANISISGPNDQVPGTTFNVDVTLTPAANVSGTSTINFIVHDESTSVTNQVTLEVTPVNNLPTIAFPALSSTNPQLFIGVGTTVTIPVTVNDVETAASDLIVTATSPAGSQAILPNSNIILGGRGSDRTLTITPIGTAGGSSTITVTATDAAGGSTTNSFAVIITPPAGQTFTANGTILIPGSGTVGPASPYPSVLNVSGMVGNISKITVSVAGLTHTSPADIDMLLVSPSGNKTLLMADAGGHHAISNVQLVFDNNAAPLPNDALITSGTYAPADYEPNRDVFPTITGNPAPPAPPYTSSLNEFIGTNPNGNWMLYIVDDAANDAGLIASGWSLQITTAPSLTLPPGTLNGGGGTYLNMTEDVPTTINVNLNDQTTQPAGITVTYSLSDPSNARIVNTNLGSISGNQGVLSVTLLSVTNGFGTNNLTITARRSDGSAQTLIVPINITPVDDVPLISRLLTQTTTADTPITVPIAITDVDTPLSNLRVTATSDQINGVVPSVNLQFGGRSNQVTGLFGNASSVASFPPGTLDTWTNFLVITPAPAKAGTNLITIHVDELDNNGNAILGQSAAASFNVVVNPVNHPPSIAGIGTNALPTFVAVEAGKSTGNLGFTVSDPDPGNTVTLTASSDNQAVVPDANIVLLASDQTTVVNGTAGLAPGTYYVRVATQPGVTGDANIAVRALDQSSARASFSFVVRATPTREQVFSNNKSITIRDNNTADPYPSTITVSGFVGVTTKVTVNLSGLWHTYPSDINMVLVSPSGKSSYIMAKAGDGNPITSSAPVNLKFDDSAANSLPNGQITSGTYKPTKLNGGPASLPSPAPAGPYTAALSNLNGDSPNGVWSLYIIDDTASDSGAIIGGWSIGITTLPRILGLADVTSPENVPAVVPFTIAEESFVNPGNYTFAVASSNPALVPSSTANIVVTGTGTNRTVTVIPTQNANTNNAGGPATITLTEQTTGVSASFKVSFTPVNNPPTITQIADQFIPAGLFTTVSGFNYSDIETPKKDLTVSISSSDPSIIPASSVVIAGTDLRIFAGTTPGTTTITISVTDKSDGFNPPQTATMSFKVTVSAALNTVVGNNNPITINDNSRATPYPSSLSVSNVNGTVGKVTVTLLGLTHPFPHDIEMLLVGPNGQAVVIMGDVGGGGSPQTSLNNASLIIDDNAGSTMPANGPIVPFSSYKPSNSEPNNSEFLPPAPAGPYATTLGGAFSGINPNGTWSLFVEDDASPDAGSLQGWVLNISLNEVGPALTGLVDTTANENDVVQVPFTVTSVGDVNSVGFTTAGSNSNLVSAIKISGSGTNRTLFITLVPNASGTSQITLNATDLTGTRTRQFLLTVNHVNQPPVFGPVPDLRISGPTNVVLNVTDVDTPLNALTFFASTAGVGLINDVQFSVNGGTVTAKIIPAPNARGTEHVTISVSDGTSTVSRSFNVTLVVQGPPTLGNIADVTTSANTPVTIPINVSDPDTALSDLVFFATESDSLISDVRFTLTSSNTVNVTITPAAGKTGATQVTVSASDGTSTANASFKLTVNSLPPVLGPIAAQTTPQDTPLTIPLTVSDPDTPLNQLTFVASTSTPNIIQNVTFITVGNSATATVTPVAGATGVGSVTISVSDGTSSVSRTFSVNVTPVCKPPVIATIGPVTTTQSSFTIPIPVTDADDALTNLTYQASTAGNSIVSGATFNATSSGVTATFTLFPNANGTEQVTVQASDGCASGKQTFSLTANVGGPQGGPATISASIAGTNFVLNVTGTPNASYVIEGTANLSAWSVVDTITLPASGTTQYTVPIVTGGHQFFRVRPGTGALAQQKTALLVVGSTTLVAGDLVVSNRLAQLGYNLTIKSGPNSASADANGKTLVVISSTISSGDVNTKFLSTTVPVVGWEQALTDDFLFNGNDATNHNTTTADQTQINILPTTHPLAAGLSAGLHTVATAGTTFSWGQPQGNAIKIATTALDTNQVAIFGYEAGATMLGTNIAAGRRVFLFLQDAGLSVTTAEGNALFDAAINWAVSGDVTKPGDSIQLVNGTNDGDSAFGPPPAAETVDHAIDDVAQKYLNFLDLGSGFAVTPSMGRTLVTGIRLWTANDAPERDPASYTLEGSANGPNGPWTTISSGALALPTGRNVYTGTPANGNTTPLNVNTGFYQTVYFPNSTAYTSYRVTFPTLRDHVAANSMQIGEVELFGYSD